MSEAAIKKGKGIVANPDFFLTFTLSGIFVVALIGTFLAAWLDYDEEHNFEGVRWWAIGLVVAIVAVAGIAKATGLGQRLFVLMMSFAALLSGILSLLVVFLLWMAPESGMELMDLPLSFETVSVEGHDSVLLAIVMALIILGLAPAVIFGERVLPLFVAFIAGVWGILSVIIFVMVIFGLHEEEETTAPAAAEPEAHLILEVDDIDAPDEPARLELWRTDRAA